MVAAVSTKPPDGGGASWLGCTSWSGARRHLVSRIKSTMPAGIPKAMVAAIGARMLPSITSPSLATSTAFTARAMAGPPPITVPSVSGHQNQRSSSTRNGTGIPTLDEEGAEDSPAMVPENFRLLDKGYCRR